MSIKEDTLIRGRFKGIKGFSFPQHTKFAATLLKNFPPIAKNNIPDPG
jgi:hypothetical protein